jgi:beta-galactosidase
MLLCRQGRLRSFRLTQVVIKERKVWVGDTAIPLIGGEVHYWRLAPESWRDVLARVREMGIDLVATYACWDFHEVAPGEFDFTGRTDPRRNLVGYLELLAEEGFWTIFRPGPYIYSEWRNNGVPDHAAQFHRLHPEFLAKSEVYMRAVTEAASPYLASRGGRIILWQADNEIDPWPHIYSEQLGLTNKPGPFQDYLRDRYVQIDALNHAWRTSYTSFEQARAVSDIFVNDPILLARYNDFRSFLHSYGNQVAQCSVDLYRSLGIDVPLILNTYSGVGTQRWADFEKIADLSGPDIYPSREFRNRGGAKEQAHILEAGRYANTYSALPYIAEWEAGIWHDWLDDVGYLTPAHYRLLGYTALQAGFAGWNWYMLVNRDNWYQAPINEWGRTKPGIYTAFQQVTRLFHQIDPTTLTRLTNTAVTFDPLQRSTERPGQEMLNGMYFADIDYDYVDLDADKPETRTLFYAGGAWLSQRGQQRLVDYVEAGGHLVLVGAYPRMDEHMHPLNLLDIQGPDGILNGIPRLHLRMLGGATVESPWAYNYETTPSEPITAERLSVREKPSEELLLQFDLQNGAQYTIGYTVQRGAGRITVVGLQPSPGLLLALHEYLGIAIPSRSRTATVSSALFSRDGEYTLIVSNTGTEDKMAEIALADGLLASDGWVAEDINSGRRWTLDTRSSPIVTVPLSAKDGTILRLFRLS